MDTSRVIPSNIIREIGLSLSTGAKKIISKELHWEERMSKIIHFIWLKVQLIFNRQKLKAFTKLIMMHQWWNHYSSKIGTWIMMLRLFTILRILKSSCLIKKATIISLRVNNSWIISIIFLESKSYQCQ